MKKGWDLKVAEQNCSRFSTAASFAETFTGYEQHMRGCAMYRWRRGFFSAFFYIELSVMLFESRWYGTESCLVHFITFIVSQQRKDIRNTWKVGFNFLVHSSVFRLEMLSEERMRKEKGRGSSANLLSSCKQSRGKWARLNFVYIFCAKYLDRPSFPLVLLYVKTQWALYMWPLCNWQTVGN